MGVDSASHLQDCSLPSSRPAVRLRVAPGNPLLPQLTAVRTSAKGGIRPAWGERCVMPLPKWCRPRANEAGRIQGKLDSVKAGWQHDGNLPDVAVFVDVYHQEEISCDDKFIARAMVLLAD